MASNMNDTDNAIAKLIRENEKLKKKLTKERKSHRKTLTELIELQESQVSTAVNLSVVEPTQ